MPTNILYLPVAILTVTAATNADWLDGLEYWDDVPPDGNPIDVTGISFDMQMRTAPPLSTVVLHASTDNGLIRVYANTWQLLVPARTMMLVPPGDYVFDLLARADGYTRNIVQAVTTVFLGITRTDLPPYVIPAHAPTIVRVEGMAHAA
jgi:hypothetical protein